MRDFTKVSRGIWKSRKFRSIKSDPGARLLYFYFLTNSAVNSAGCYDLDEGAGSAAMGWTDEQYRKGIETLSRVFLIEFDHAEETVLIVNWMAFNEPMNAKHAMGMISALQSVSSEPLKNKRMQELVEVIERKKFAHDRALGADLGRLCIQYRKGIVTEDKTQTETEDKTRLRLDENQTGEGASARGEVAAPAPSGNVHHLLATLDKRKS